VRIDVLLDEKIGIVNLDIYGHFVEHLGGVVYDGIWVGEKSLVRNYGGLHADLVDALKRIKAPNARRRSKRKRQRRRFLLKNLRNT